MKSIYVILLATIGGLIYFFFFHFYLFIATPLAALSSKLKDLYSKKEEEEVELHPYGAGEERRCMARSHVELPCVVSGLSHGQLIHENARVMNINQRGMYIEAKTLFDEGSEIKAQIKTNRFSRTPFNGGSEMIARIKAMRFGKTFWVMGKVLRSTTRGMAVRFADLVQGGSKVILHAR